MATILNIDTSTEVCSVALAIDGKTVALREDFSGKNHALQLTRFIEGVLATQNIGFENLSAFAISGGPGSYTGLRIGVSTAKGICYAAELPLIAISPLEAMARYIADNQSQLNINLDENALLCPMIDARRMEVYTALFDSQGNLVRGTNAAIIDHHSFAEEFSKTKLYFFGNGAAKCQIAITNSNAVFLENIYTSAAHLSAIAEKRFTDKIFVDTAYFEPFYLKDFVATIPTKNILITGLK